MEKGTTETSTAMITNDDSNKLIAEFMESDSLPHRYDSSWDWLMPVVEKIAKNYDISIRYFDTDCACYINKQSIEGADICSYGNFEPSIVNVYKAVVEFIKWHNELKH
jgi:hypothetical protein